MSPSSVIFLILTSKIINTNCFETCLNNEMHKKTLNPTVCENQLKSLESKTTTLFVEVNENFPNNIELKRPTNYVANFDKCLSIADQVAGADLSGKYCRVKISVPSTIPYDAVNNETLLSLEKYAKRRKSLQMLAEYGCDVKASDNESPSKNFILVKVDICIPAACTTEQAVEWVFSKNITFDGRTTLGVKYESEFCRIAGDKPFSKSDIVGIVIFSILLILTILSTVYDVNCCVINKSSIPDPLYSSFSIYTNTRQLVTYRTTEDVVECADGIRVLSLVWIIVFHKAIWLHGFENHYKNNHSKWNFFELLFVLPGHMAVDTFFVLSGLFMVYTTIKLTSESFIKNLHMLYIRRLLRLWPLMAASLLVISTFYIHIADGPNWNNTAKVVNGCRQTWWLKLLFIQNFVRFCSSNTKKCLGHFWYLAVDMQLFVVSPLVLVWLFGSQRTARVALTLTVLLSFAACAAISFAFNYSYNGIPFDPFNAIPSNILFIYGQDYNYQYYRNPLARSPPYAVGMLAGYVLHCYRKRKLQLKKPFICILWSLSLLTIFGIICVTKPVYKGQLTQTVHNVLNGFSRGIFGMAVAWIIVACHKGYGGPVNWFLSLRMWKLLSRLSYAMYIVHLPIMSLEKELDTKEELNRHLEISACVYDLLQSFVLAFILKIFVESPIFNLKNLFLVKIFSSNA